MNKKYKIGYTTGVFDLFHVGHLNILRNAKALCEYLIVGVTTDEITMTMKQKMPVVPFAERLSIVENIKFVDQAVAKISLDNTEAWKQLHFDVMFKGDDWKGTDKGKKLEEDFAKYGVEIYYFPYTAHTSSTILKKAIGEFIELNNG